jgi:pimeloyl-ACP methyl ester carboxylesterase
VAEQGNRNMAAYANLHWWSNDGVRLHARDYPGDPTRVPLICLPGLTRNARDFATFAEAHSGARRVIAVDLRGRGESGYAKDAMSYVPLTYVQDIEALLAEQGITRFAAVGTSLGGIVTMLLAGPAKGRLAGAVLNDIGPEIETAGLQRIRGYVGRGSSCPTWLHAARTIEENNRDVYPNWGLEEWLAMAKRLYRLSSSGRIVLDYDMRIAEPFRVPGAEAGPDMWGALAGLADIPVLLVRGARSDLLSEAVTARMATALPGAERVTVPDVGHAPTLDEPAATAAIDRWLARLD